MIGNKKFRTISTIVWGMVFCFNLILCLWTKNPHPLSWILVGISLGVVWFMLITNKHMNLQNRFIDVLIAANKKYVSAIDMLVNIKSITTRKVKKKKMKK